MMVRGMQPWQMWCADASAHKGLLGRMEEMADAVFKIVRSYKVKVKFW